MSEAEVGKDRVRERVRQCGKCKDGLMFCASLTQHRVNNNNVGRDYLFRCANCGHTVLDYNAERVSYQVIVLATCGGFGGVLLFFGGQMGLDALVNGFGSNDASAMIVVLALFLLGGGGLFALALGGAWGLFVDWRARKESAELRPPSRIP